MLTQSFIVMVGLDPCAFGPEPAPGQSPGPRPGIRPEGASSVGIHVPAAAEPGAEGGVDHRVKAGDDDCEPS